MNRSYSFGIFYQSAGEFYQSAGEFYQSAGEKYLIHNIVIPASSISAAFKKARAIEVALNNCWNAYRVCLLDTNGVPLCPESIDSVTDPELPF